jgi:hypothetical protein
MRRITGFRCPYLRGALLGALFFAAPLHAATMTVYKTATCGCCTAWVEHVRAAGFEVEAIDVARERLIEHKQSAGLDRRLASCHTATIDGYVIEGHVPAADIRRLLEQRPDVAGLAVPGMPVGSPGMEVGDRVDPYRVIAFDRRGGLEIFAEYGG